MPKEKLTKRAVEALQAATSTFVVWDTELKGFALKVAPTGRKTYLLSYRSKSTGTERRPGIGTHGAITTEQARDIARRWLFNIANGEDPSLDRKELSKAPTVEDLCRRFMSEHSQHHNKPRTRYNYQRLIDRFILPAIGRRKVREIRREHVQQLHAQASGTPYQANRLLGLVSVLMRKAELWGYRPDNTNPRLHIEKNKEHKRQTTLTAHQLVNLGAILNSEEDISKELPSVPHAIWLLLLTGCRMSEILTLKWEYIDFDHACIRFPDSKTGAKIIPINSSAMRLLNRISRTDKNPYVVPGKKLGHHLVNLEKPWRRIRKKAGLSAIRLHDLRHTFGSMLAAQGHQMPMIAKLLGHSQLQTTARYIHLAPDPVKDATNKIGTTMDQLIGANRQLDMFSSNDPAAKKVG